MTSVKEGDQCLICRVGTIIEARREGSTAVQLVECGHCGQYVAFYVANELSQLSELDRGKLAYRVRNSSSPPRISTEYLQSISDVRLPNFKELCDNLLMLAGKTLETPGSECTLTYEAHGAIVGAPDGPSFDYAERTLVDQSLFEREGRVIRLTYEGWLYFDELRRGKVESRIGFIAMPFSSSELNEVRQKIIDVAIRRAGFEPRRLDEDHRAGSIDDKLRVHIRTARFLVAEVTLQNPNVHWEAGFAEGLGRPVIFVCKKASLSNGTQPFDTNHWLHITWETPDDRTAQDRLTATIRATLPEEANLQDEVDVVS